MNGRTARTYFKNNGPGRDNELVIKDSVLKSSAAEIDAAVAQLPSNTKTVTISQESDLPAVVATAKGLRHLLQPNTDYLFVFDLDTGTDPFFTQGNTLIRAVDSSIVKLTYTGTDPLFANADDTTSRIQSIGIDCPNAELLDQTGSGNYIFQMDDCTVDRCTAIGLMSDFQAAQINNCSFEDNSVNGLRFAGVNGAFLAERNLFAQNAGIAIDMQTATFTAFSLSNNFPALDPGASFLKRAPDSANMIAGRTGTVINTKNLSGAGTMLVGATDNGAQWEFELNDGIPDTRPDALISLTGNITPTDTSPGTPVKINAVWTIERASQFEATADGRLAYRGIKPATLAIDLNVTADVDSGTNKDIEFYLAVGNDGDTPVAAAIIPNSAAPNQVGQNNAKNTSLVWQLVFNKDDFIEPWVKDTTASADVIARSAKFRIN
jgi:hypothetical protein